MTDYIKRGDVLNASKIVYIEYIAVDDEGYADGDADDIPCVFKEDIEKIPAADVRENVHAHWIHQKNWGERYVCSNCSKEMTESQIGAFCKECGAIMDGGDDR